MNRGAAAIPAGSLVASLCCPATDQEVLAAVALPFGSLLRVNDGT